MKVRLPITFIEIATEECELPEAGICLRLSSHSADLGAQKARTGSWRATPFSAPPASPDPPGFYSPFSRLLLLCFHRPPAVPSAATNDCPIQTVPFTPQPLPTPQLPCWPQCTPSLSSSLSTPGFASASPSLHVLVPLCTCCSPCSQNSPPALTSHLRPHIQHHLLREALQAHLVSGCSPPLINYPTPISLTLLPPHRTAIPGDDLIFTFSCFLFSICSRTPTRI